MFTIEPERVLAHDGQRVLGREPRALEVHREAAIERLDGHDVGARVAQRNAGAHVVVHDVDGSETLGHVLDQRCDGVLDGHVHFASDGLVALAGDHVHGVLGGVHAPVGDHHLRALARQQHRRGAAVADRLAGRLTAADHDGDFVRDASWHAVRPRRGRGGQYGLYPRRHGLHVRPTPQPRRQQAHDLALVARSRRAALANRCLHGFLHGRGIQLLRQITLVDGQLRLLDGGQVRPFALRERLDGLAVLLDALHQDGLFLVVAERRAGPQLVDLGLLLGCELDVVAVQDQPLLGQRARQLGLLLGLEHGEQAADFVAAHARRQRASRP